jgi:GWxTD domain-containing protein
MSQLRQLKIINLLYVLALVIAADFTVDAGPIPFNNNNSQLISTESDSLYNKGIDALIVKDTITAERYFKNSILENDNSPARVELAKIYLNRNDFYSRDLAYENFKFAVLMDPTNIKYKYFYADICKDFSRITAFEQYNEILMLDSSQVNAWLNLGYLKDEDFTEYNHSVRNMDEFNGSLQEQADNDFYEAEKYYKRVLSLDPKNYTASLRLSLLYEKANLSEKGIQLLTNLIENRKGDKDVYLSLGLLHYKTKRLKTCMEEYKHALELMCENEREDFVFNSVKVLLQPVLEKEVKTLSDYELSQIIEQFWKASDPLYLTDYNERLLEHYSRVAFANLHFSVPKMGIVGWKSDRGETVLRYGEPLNLIRIRPQMDGNGVLSKTEVWNYRDMTLGFADMNSSGNYQFTSPAVEKDKIKPQFNGDTQFYAEYLRNVRFETFEPKYEGPTFKVDYKISQFKSGVKRNHTDIYINYAMVPIDSLIQNGDYYDPHLAAFFFFNRQNEELLEEKEPINSLSANSIIRNNLDEQFYSNVIGISSPVDSGFYSFEILRGRDKGVSSSRANFGVVKYSNFHLDMSNLLIALRIQKDQPQPYYINRGKINILPYPITSIKTGNPLYIYYELYNLETDEDHMTNFEQSVDIREYDSSTRNGLEKTVGNVLDFFGFDSEEKIGFTNTYKSKENNPQLYFKLDLTGAKTGKYLITITVTDKVANTKTTGNTVVDWVN